MKELRPELPPLPERMDDLRADRGYPVPRFVQDIDGRPDFRVADSGFKEESLRRSLCYVCGKAFTTRHRWYVIGPMCVINRTTGEPAVHLECAVYSAQGCPFLSRPQATRRENDLPKEIKESEFHIRRNPGAMALYQTRTYKVYRTGPGHGEYVLLLGEPDEVLWYCKGQRASYAEVVRSIHSGYPLLMESANREGAPALQSLREATHRALCLLPPKETEEDIEAGNLILALGEMLGKAVQANYAP